MRQPLAVAVLALVVVLAAITGCEPVQGDGWAHYLSAGDPLSWDRFLTIARDYHEHGNPRWGQLALIVSYHHAVVAWLISPLAITGMLLAALTLSLGRWPVRRSPEDAWLFVGIVAAALVTTPNVGAVWFHRPACTNYVYPLALQLAWLVPYRFLSLRTARGSLVATLAIIPLGLLAGAGNEHTGPGLGVAGVWFAAIAWRRDRRLPAWTITGIASVVAGSLLLLTAPGQQLRYAGLAAKQSLWSPLVERGVAGSLDVIVVPLLWSIPMLGVLAVAGCRRVPRDAIGFLVIAAAIVATVLLSPRLPLRLFAAPAMLFAIAFTIAMSELAMRRLRQACATIAAVLLGLALVIHVVTGLEGRARLARLVAAAPGSTVHVPQYTFGRVRLIAFGDDFRSPALVAQLGKHLGLTIIWR